VTTTGPRLSIKDLSVSFAGHRAVDSLDLDIFPGAIVGLLGANGSGKSTTVKALSGINVAEPGTRITINDQLLRTESLSPVEARARGVRVVHQEAPLVPDLTIAEAIALHTGFPTAGGFIRQRELRRRAGAVLEEFGVDVDVTRLCRTLSPAERSLISLAIAIGDISVDNAVLILDEATASLSTADAERFLVKVRQSADDGLAVLMVTHRLPEVAEHCDEAVVLRDGRVVERFTKQTFNEIEVVRAMVGAEAESVRATGKSGDHVSSGANALEVKALTGNGVADASFTVKPGEVLGVTGRIGGGASELLRLLGGMDPIDAGSVVMGTSAVALGSPRDSIKQGMFYLSSDRLVEGGIATMTIAENLTLPKVERYGWGTSKSIADVDSMMSLLDVRPPDPSVTFGSLSGGNQQKVLLARWLLLKPQVLLLDDPTAGVDPNTRELMFQTFGKLADAGTTIILRSTEPEQLVRLCNRVLVMRDGRITNELNSSHVTIEEISLATYA
jgi:ABC-type sugar transport system ATPase subunit